MQELVFLKLGGSLITDKTQAYTARHEKLADLASQIARSLHADPELRLVLGHGSGSFGHTAAKKYGTRDGAPLRLPPFSSKMGGAMPSPPAPLPGGEGSESSSPFGGGVMGEDSYWRYWRGFAEVWYQASRLNRYVIQALHEAGVPAMTFSPAASVWSQDGKVLKWDLSQIEYALERGIVPVVHGDVIFDRTKGGTILSTEDLFEHLARELHPGRILLAGLEEAVWADFPARRHRVEVLTRESFNEISSGVGESAGADVTGGMQSKVQQMLAPRRAGPGVAGLDFFRRRAGKHRKGAQKREHRHLSDKIGL
jgi:isopentenyl phosphate kinase